MASTTINLSDFTQWTQDFKRLVVSDQDRVIRYGAERAAVTFDGIVRDMLPPAVRRLSVAQYWTPKQRRWWWATMHAKALHKSKALPGWKAVYKVVDGHKTLVISGAYKRTGTLIKSLAYEIEQSHDETRVVYGTKKAYARYVLDKDDQSKYHAGNWPVLQTLAQQHAEVVRGAFADGVYTQMARIVRGETT
jgi:hypothetical protein